MRLSTRWSPGINEIKTPKLDHKIHFSFVRPFQHLQFEYRYIFMYFGLLAASRHLLGIFFPSPSISSESSADLRTGQFLPLLSVAQNAFTYDRFEHTSLRVRRLDRLEPVLRKVIPNLYRSYTKAILILKRFACRRCV